MNNDKSLVLIYDPHNLLQFVWYYCTYSEKTKWDALCMPNGHKKEYMSKYCKKSGIFENVYSSQDCFLQSDLCTQFNIFLKMFGSALLRKQKSLAYSLLKQYVDIDEYSKIVVLTDHGLVAGLFMLFADEKTVVVLEDGKGDYMWRTKKRIFENFWNLFELKGFLLSNMGFANTAHKYPLKTTRNCIKFASHPEKMRYTEYKEINKLFEFKDTDISAYTQITQQIYGNLKRYLFDEIDAIVFTSNMADFVLDTNEYRKKIEEYVNGTCQKILLKKHPRDIMEYSFSENICVQEISPEIPAEVLLPLIKGKRVIFFYTSALMLYMDGQYKAECMYFSDLYDKSKKQTTYFDYMNEREFDKEINELCGSENIQIIRL